MVLDEADRMIDMGFEPQVHTILEAMGGLLMSEDEILLEQQRAALARGEACYRITAMFSDDASGSGEIGQEISETPCNSMYR